MYVGMGYRPPSQNAIFRCCPFNDTMEQIIRSVRIYENRKGGNTLVSFYNLISEFLFLAADYEPPCCEDGRTFYEKNMRGDILLVCDRCGAIYSLDGRPIKSSEHVKMSREEFIDLLGEDTENYWSNHRALLKNLGRCRLRLNFKLYIKLQYFSRPQKFKTYASWRQPRGG